MAEQNDRAFTGSIPALYERYMVPLLFEPYAEDLAARAKALAPGRLLEVAAGTGVVTRALAAALPDTAITATDLNEAMLDFAITKLTARHVTYRPADGQALPFPDASFDMVACQFGIMFFPDRVQGFREARRVLAAGGRYLFSVWADLGANDLPETITESVTGTFTSWKLPALRNVTLKTRFGPTSTVVGAEVPSSFVAPFETASVFWSELPWSPFTCPVGVVDFSRP